MSTTYNGHKNWTQWNVSLWINNDEVLYHMARRYVRRSFNREAAALGMKQELADMGIMDTPDGARYSKTAIRAAMCGL